MTEVRVHQLLHGYRNGHERLAGSVKLSAKDAELVARLSDLSGALQTGNLFEPYLTVYPLPSGTYYAVAKTWPDLKAPRSGCVLTHTLLTPLEDWADGAVSIDDMVAIFSFADRHDLSRFDSAVCPETNVNKPTRIDVALPQMEEFVSRYFGEGIRPIAWFRDEESADLLVGVLRILWGTLRASFSGCSFSLQPRSLLTAPFDLLFAPTIAYSRFSRFSRDNVIEAKSKRGAVSHEPWVRSLSEAIIHSKSLPVPADWSDLAETLNPDPTAVRWLYLLSDLRGRAATSPMAALGTMDVIETLSPDSSAKLELKSAVADEAVDALAQFSGDAQALEFGQLVCERLSHQSFSGVSPITLDRFSRAIASKSEGDIEGGLSSYATVRNRARLDTPAIDAFKRGITQALLSASKDDLANLRALRRFDSVASEIVPGSPVLVERYLKAGSSAERDAAADLARWLAQTKVSVNWKELAERTLPLAQFVDDQAVYREIFTHLEPSDVKSMLGALPTNALLSDQLLNVVENQVLSLYPILVRELLGSQCEFSQHAARIVGKTFLESSRPGWELHRASELTDRGRITVLAEIVLSGDENASRAFNGALEELPELFVEMLTIALEGRERVLRALKRLTEGVRVLPPQSIVAGLIVPSVLERDDLPDWVCSAVSQGVIDGGLRGAVEVGAFGQILVLSKSVSNWIYDAESQWFVGVLASAMSQSGSNVQMGWSWLAEAPMELYRTRHVVSVSLVAELCRRTSGHWSIDVAQRWQEVLRKAIKFCDPRFALRHCVQALEFAYKNKHLPVAGVVSAAFPLIYSAVADGLPFVDEASYLVSYDWDKAKGLRRNLVEAFYHSELAPGDLAIAAKRSFGLRKMFKRIWRKWYGEDYLEKMIKDLRSRHDREADDCRDELMQLMRNPHFHEPWD